MRIASSDIANVEQILWQQGRTQEDEVQAQSDKPETKTRNTLADSAKSRETVKASR